MGKRRFTQVSTSEDEEEPTRNDAGARRKGKKLRVGDEVEEEARQKAAGSSRGGDAAGGSSSGGGGGGGGNRKQEEVEEPPLEDAKPKGPVLRVSGKGKRKKRHYCSFEYDGNTFELEDPVLLTPEDKKQKPYVAIIKDITQDGDGNMMVTGQRFYRPEEAKRKNGGSWEARDTRELFYSFHLDEVPAESVMHGCIVHFVPLNKKLPLRSEHPGFIVQKVYDTVEKKLWKLTDKDYEDNKQHEIDLLVKKTFDRLGDLPDVEPEDAPADDADQSASKKSLGKKRMHSIDVSRTEDAPGRSDFLTRADTPGSCTEYRAILAKFKALTGDSYRDKWLDKLLQGIKAACCSKEDASAEDKRTGNGASDHNTTGNNSEDNSAGRICWPDDAVLAITALERATHETLGSDFQKYNQKMRQLDFNLKNNVMLARRLLNKELDPVVILNMSPNELKDAAETLTSDGIPVLYLNGDGFLPSHPAANAIVEIMRSHFDEPWVSWKKIPHTVRDMWFAELKRRYRFVPPNDQWARKNFEKRGAARLKNLLANSRRNMERPSWLRDYVWDRLCQHWHTVQYQEKCEKAKQNRASDCEGFGASLHTGGSITTSQHRHNMTVKTGVMPSPSELFMHTHQKKNKSWVDRRSEHISVEFRRNIEEAQSQRAFDLGQQQLPPSELDVWVRTVGGKKKGMIYGLGSESTVLTGPSYFQGQALSYSQWMQSQELQEQVKKQVEAEWNSRVEVAERERDGLRRRVEHNERLLHELIEKINFQSSSSFQASPSFQSSPSQSSALHPYQSYHAPTSQSPSCQGRDDIEEGH